mgnify:CR=1 FL=1
MAVDKGYMSGSSRLLILNLLSEKSYYGYELIKTLSGNNKSEKWIKFNNSLDYLHSGFHAIKF